MARDGLDSGPGAAGADDPESESILAGLESVRVLVYEVGDDGQAMLNFVEEASTALEADDWQLAVYVQDADDKVRIYVKFDEENLAGLTILVADSGGEAVFANFAGSIDPAKLGGIASTFGVDDVIGDIAGISDEATITPEASQD